MTRRRWNRRCATSASPAPASTCGPRSHRRPITRSWLSTMCWRARTRRALPARRAPIWAGSQPRRSSTHSMASARHASSIRTPGRHLPSASRKRWGLRRKGGEGAWSRRPVTRAAGSGHDHLVAQRETAGRPSNGRRSSRMRAVTFLGDRKLAFMDFPDPSPGPGEAVLEIKASGMCGSDLKFYRATGGAATLGLGKVSGPIIAGHEPCGVIAAIGGGVPERRGRVGDRVMVHHYTGCGTCEHCLTGWSQMCINGSIVYGATGHGAHARYMRVPAHTLVPLPESLSVATGAAISCGTGTAFGALRRMNLSGRDTIVIVGQGPVGLSATQLAAAMGARVIALDVSAERLQRAKEFGADILIDPKSDDPIAAIKQTTHGLGADLSLDTSAAPEGRLAAVRSVRAW